MTPVEQKCPVCMLVSKMFSVTVGSNIPGVYADCVRCGVYTASFLVQRQLEPIDATWRSILSHGLRKASDRGQPITLFDHNDVQRVIENGLPRAQEQADNLLLWIGERVAPGEGLLLNADHHMAVSGAKTPEAFQFIVSGLIENRTLTEVVRHFQGEGPALFNVTPSFAGWERFHELQKGKADSHHGFMAMKFGDPVLDGMFSTAFQPACRGAGFDLRRLDHSPKAGLIDNHLRNEIRLARFLIADLSHDNAGAYWEAGFAEGLGKPVIYTCEESKFKTKGTHFDTNHNHTVFWTAGNDAQLIRDLKATIRTTLPDEALLTDP